MAQVTDLLALQGHHVAPIALPGVIARDGLCPDGHGRFGVFFRHPTPVYESLSAMDVAASTAIVETSFNSDFYVAASTIIPVLFIALAVQVPLFVRVRVAYQGFAHIRANERTTGMLDRGGLTYRAIFSVSSWLLICVLVLIVAAGVLGELLAFYALYQQHAQLSTRDIVFWLTVVLVLGVPTGAIATFVGGVYNARPPKADAQATDEGPGKPKLAGDTESAAASTSNMPDEGSDNPSTQ